MDSFILPQWGTSLRSFVLTNYHQLLTTTMKRIFTLVSILVALASLVSAQDYSVTFKVDASGITVDATGLHMAGNFQAAAGLAGDWTPSESPLDDSDGNGIYTVTYTLPAGSYLYKYVNGNDWGDNEGLDGTSLGSDCSTDDGSGNINRDLTVSSDTILPVYIYDSCEINADATSIRDRMVKLGIRVAPNPMGEAAVLTFDNQQSQAFTVTVVAVDGRIVRQYDEVRSNQITIERGEMPAGLYFVNFVNEEGKRASTSLMVK